MHQVRHARRRHLHALPQLPRILDLLLLGFQPTPLRLLQRDDLHAASRTHVGFSRNCSLQALLRHKFSAHTAPGTACSSYLPTPGLQCPPASGSRPQGPMRGVGREVLLGVQLQGHSVTSPYLQHITAVSRCCSGVAAVSCDLHPQLGYRIGRLAAREAPPTSAVGSTSLETLSVCASAHA